MIEHKLTLDVFNSLEINKQVEYVNEFLRNSVSLNQFGKDIGIDEGGIRKRFKKAGYVRGRNGKRLFKLENQNTFEENKEAPAKIEKEKVVPKVIDLDSEDDKKVITKQGFKNINELINRLNEVEKELTAVKKDVKLIKDKTTEDNIKANTSHSEAIQEHIFEPDTFESSLKQISYRYHKEVLEKLDKLCGQYPHYSKTSILNTLLNKAIDEYLK